jgi:hypothetical protein
MVITTFLRTFYVVFVPVGPLPRIFPNSEKVMAEKKCRNIRAGQVAFSPTLVAAWNKIHAWKLLRKKLSGKKVNSRYLQRSLKAANKRYIFNDPVRCGIQATWLEELGSNSAEMHGR